MLEALIFDFDGLILDTETPEVQAWTDIFREHGAQYPEEYWIHSIGRGAEQITESPIQLLQRLSSVAVELSRVLEDYEVRRMTAINASLCLPGIEDLIKESKSKSLKLGVASSSKHAWVDGHLKRLGLLDRFDVVVCAEDVALAKPFPELYELALSQLDVCRAATIALEDSPNGIKAAKAAGIPCIAIPNRCTVNLDLSEADWMFGSSSDLTVAMLESLLIDLKRN